MKCAITAQLRLGNNRTLAQLRVCIVNNMEKVVIFEHVDSEFS